MQVGCDVPDGTITAAAPEPPDGKGFPMQSPFAQPLDGTHVAGALALEYIYCSHPADARLATADRRDELEARVLSDDRFAELLAAGELVGA